MNTRFDDIEDQFQTDWAALPEERTVSFEDPAELLRVLTASRLDVFLSVKSEPGSITVIAERLHRDRSAVKRDVDQLAQVGLVTMETKTLPGYGLMKETRAAAGVFLRSAEVSVLCVEAQPASARPRRWPAPPPGTNPCPCAR